MTDDHVLPPSAALSAIRAAIDQGATQAPTPLVNRPVLLDREFLSATFGLRTSARRTIYADVPLSAIDKNFAPEATTWRGLLAGLYGQGWGPETLAYFESEIGDTHFPAPAAAYPLILRAYGGAVVGVNGMHRLVVAVCWLSARHGAHAVLKKVELEYYGIRAAAVDVMVDAARRGEPIEAVHNAACETVLLRVLAARGPRYWRVDGETVRCVERLSGWLDAARRLVGVRPRLEAALHWQPVSETVLTALADDQWIQSQLERPRYRAVPR